MTGSENSQTQPTQIVAVPAKNRERHRRRTVEGLVVSDKMSKTIVVKVDRRVRHTLYKKYVLHSRRYKAHDETHEAKVGDRVSLVESRPLSREKRWVLQKIVRRAGEAAQVNL